MSISLKEKTYDMIKNKIISCEYAPNTYINEKQLCEELNVSRTPVRDALSRLEHEQLVTIIPKKGVLVSPITIHEINNIFEARLLFEPYIISKYGTRIDEDILNRLHELLSTYKSNIDNESIAFLADDEFHQILIELCKNKYLIQLHSKIYSQNARVRIMSGNFKKERLIDTHNEHCEIVEHLVKMDYQKAAKAMHNHLQSAKDAAFKTIFDNETVFVNQNTLDLKNETTFNNDTEIDSNI
ncbi:MAG: GntR family transcriptional regulator [Clostridiales bacterium]|nr:GntR family transcriptional regulator [Clostridiales bacterium]